MPKIKLPKEHITAGHAFSIRQNSREDCGGRFHTGLAQIEIGDYCSRPQLGVEYLLHECFEASCCMHEVRFGAQEEQYQFVMDHRTMKVLLAELSGTVLKLMKANGYKENKDG